MPTWSFVQVGLLLLMAAPAMTQAQNDLASAPAGVTNVYVAVMTNKVGSIQELEGVRLCWAAELVGGCFGSHGSGLLLIRACVREHWRAFQRAARSTKWDVCAVHQLTPVSFHRPLRTTFTSTLRGPMHGSQRALSLQVIAARFGLTLRS